MTSTLTRQEISAPTNPFQNSISEFFRQANRIPNTYLNKYENGTWARHIDGNPIAWIEDGGKTTSKYSQILGSMFGEIKLLPGLKLKGIAGVNFDVDEGKTHIKEMYYGDGTTQGPNSIQDNLGRNMNITLQSLLNYEKSFAAHNFKGLLGISRESFTYSYTSAYRKNLPSNELTELNAGSIDGWSNSGYSTESRIISYFGRINYDYHGKYLLEANLRTDGSSKFAEGKRWGTFPSFSVGWRISNEEFMTNIRWINKLKLRGSWGKLGNHRIADYTYISKITLGQNYDFGGSIYPGAATTSASNAEISWETTTEMDLGIDAEFYNGKILFGIDYYDRYTDDILTNVPVSMIYGLAAPTTNAGAMSNKGFELQLGHRNKVDGLNYEINGYATYNKNIVEKYLNPYVGDNIYKEGYSWGAHYGYESIGIFQTDEEASTSPVHSPNVKAGDLKFKDQNNDGKIDSEDRVVLGNWMPSITYGINLSAAYKGVDFRATLQGVSDSYRNVDDEAMWGLINGSNAQYKQMDRAIVEDGKVVVQGFYPRTLVNQSHNRVKSSFTVMKADYLRLKNLQLGYNLPKELTKKSYLSSARIYVSGQNIFTLTKFPKDMDPENGSASYAYPQVAIYTLGLDLTF
jgi:TonB-linked SusC/RagA family outer membrane protein